MEHDYTRILLSNDPAEVKKKQIDEIIEAGKGSQLSRESFRAMLHCCIQLITRGDDSQLVAESSRLIFKEWSANNLQYFTEFFTVKILTDVLLGNCRYPSDGLWIACAGLELVKSSGTPSYRQLCRCVADQAASFLRNRADCMAVIDFCAMLLDHDPCYPAAGDGSWFCSSLLSAVVKILAPRNKSDFDALGYELCETVGQLMNEIWKCDGAALNKSIQDIFDSLLRPTQSACGLAFGPVADCIPDEAMMSAIKQVATDGHESDHSLTCAACRMIDWLTWPRLANVDRWVVSFIRYLASAHRYQVLMSATENRATQLFQGLKYDSTREQCFTVLTHLLLGYRYSPRVFHKTVLPYVPEVMTLLRREAHERDVSASQLLPQLVELLHCLMFLHPGFPDLYAPTMSAIMALRLPAPKVSQMHERLALHAWASASCHVGAPAAQLQSDVRRPLEQQHLDTRSDTGLTGLGNLGTTCYMNSVIQALYMCESFREDVLSAQPSDGQALLSALQQLFAFLAHTKRPYYMPERFFKQSKPPWFESDIQHDCSEYLKYLLDQLHEQEIAGRPSQPASVTSSQDEEKTGKKKKVPTATLR